MIRGAINIMQLSIQKDKYKIFGCTLIILFLAATGCNEISEQRFCADERGPKFKFSADQKNEFDLHFTNDGNNVSYRLKGVSFAPDAEHITIKSSVSSKRIAIEGFLTLKIGKDTSHFENVRCVASDKLNNNSKNITIDCVNTHSKVKNIFYWDSEKGITKFLNVSSELGDLLYFSSDSPRLARFCG